MMATIETKNKRNPSFDLGTPEFHKQVDRVMKEIGAPQEQNRGKRQVDFGYVMVQIPLDYYYHRTKPLIEEHQYEAGNKLFCDFRLAGQDTRLVAALDDSRGGAKDYTEMQLEAIQRMREAIASVHGKIGQLMVLNVCCYGYMLKDINYLVPLYDKNSIMARFREALNDLAEFYGFA